MKIFVYRMLLKWPRYPWVSPCVQPWRLISRSVRRICEACRFSAQCAWVPSAPWATATAMCHACDHEGSSAEDGTLSFTEWRSWRDNNLLANGTHVLIIIKNVTTPVPCACSFYYFYCLIFRTHTYVCRPAGSITTDLSPLRLMTAWQCPLGLCDLNLWIPQYLLWVGVSRTTRRTTGPSVTWSRTSNSQQVLGKNYLLV